MATKADLAGMATKADLAEMATKADVNAFRSEVNTRFSEANARFDGMATKTELNAFRSDVSARFDGVDKKLGELDKDLTGHMRVHRELQRTSSFSSAVHLGQPRERRDGDKHALSRHRPCVSS